MVGGGRNYRVIVGTRGAGGIGVWWFSRMRLFNMSVGGIQKLQGEFVALMEMCMWREKEATPTFRVGMNEDVHLDHNHELPCEHGACILSMAMGQMPLPRVGGGHYG